MYPTNRNPFYLLRSEPSSTGDPLLSILATSVVATSTVEPSPLAKNTKKGPQKQEKATAPPSVTEPFFQVVLHDTVLFPEGGGQPYDVGLITTDDGTVWNVEYVKRHGGVAVHYIKAGGQSQSVPAVFETGKKVVVELGEEGLKRRLDHVRGAPLPPSEILLLETLTLLTCRR